MTLDIKAATLKCLILCFGISLASAQETIWKETKLRIHGSNTVGEKFAPELVEGYLKTQGFTLITEKSGSSPVEKQFIAEDPDKKTRIIVELAAHGSSTGFKDLAAGKTDIAMSSRKIKSKEVETLKASYPSIGEESTEIVIAYDALAVITHPENKVSTLSLEQIASIFSGEVVNWKELGGDDAPIEVLARDNNSGTYDTFLSLVLKPFEKTLAVQAARLESSRELATKVLNSKNAIGFVGASHTNSTQIIAIAKEAGALGIKPDQYTIGTEDYPLSRKLYLYLPKEIDKPLAQEFVDFSVSGDGQTLAKFADLISFYPTLSRPSFKGIQLEKKYAGLVTYGQRLSVVLRLQEGQIDSRTRRDLERIVSYKKQNPHRRLVLAGFWSDPQEKSSTRKNIDGWVNAFKEQLSAKEIDAWDVYGGYLPIENNSVETGKLLNRRVEVWAL